MFDRETTLLIRAAPALPGLDADHLPQRLTRDYVELTALRLEASDDEIQTAMQERLSELSQIATFYESVVDRGARNEARRASAFVAATAYQICAKFVEQVPGERSLLTAGAIDPAIAAPLLFLIAEQSPDAREAVTRLGPLDGGDLVRIALLETIADLATERFDEIMQRSERLQELGSGRERDLETRTVISLYGLCWRGITQLTAQLLGRDVPPSKFVTMDTARGAFETVVRQSTHEIQPPMGALQLRSTFAGPRHLARLLIHVCTGFQEAGLANLPVPNGCDSTFWRNWLAHRAKTKPVLWPNHRSALATGFHAPGQSAVLVLPTGAGKTSIAEIKIAATLAAGRQVVFLVPTLALVDQLRDDLAESFPRQLTAVVPSVNSDLTILAGGVELGRLEVMTPERCLAILSFAPDVFGDVGLIVFDECHLLSPAGGGKRSLDAMLCLVQAVQRAPNADLLLLSAMLTNQGELSDWIETLIQRPCHSISDLWKPSRQARGVVIYDQDEVGAAIAPIPEWRQRCEAARAMKRRAPRKPPTRVTPFGLFGLQHNWHPDVPQDTSIVRLLNDRVDLAIPNAGARLTPNANHVAAKLAARAVRRGLKTLVFVQNATHAPATARRLSDQVPAPAVPNDREISLWNQIQAELGGTEFSLVDPERGALPHNANMLALERQFAEQRFRRSDGVSALVASPTLAQGMNLPAQLAILAGDKRHDEDGRSPLEAHEILNAAGRAGRAGFLANGVVLLVPEPIVVFEEDGPEDNAIEKLRGLLPSTDACLEVVDPLTDLLDRIQAGDTQSRDTRYLLSRLSAGQEEGNAPAAVAGLVGRSFYAYKLAAANEQERCDAAIAAVQTATQELDDEGDAWLAEIAAFTGQLSRPLIAAKERLQANIEGVPQDILGWSDWLIDWLRDDPESRADLLVDDALLLKIVRGRKTGGAPTIEEFDRLKLALRGWLDGSPLRDIEIALGVPAERVRHCPRARDLALKLTTRGLYITFAAVAAIAKRVLVEAEAVPANPVVLDTLPFAIRAGIDQPEKAAFLHLNSHLRSRVVLHQTFANQLPNIGPIVAGSFAELIRDLSGLLNFLYDIED